MKPLRLASFFLTTISIGVLVWGDIEVGSRLDRAVENILRTLRQVNALPSLQITDSILLEHELKISLMLEEPEHYLHLLEEWQYPKTVQEMNHHNQACDVCSMVTSILSSANLVEIDRVDLNHSQSQFWRDYQRRLWTADGYLRRLDAGEALGLIHLIESNLYRAVKTCRPTVKDCQASKDLNAVVSSSDLVENDLGVLYELAGKPDESMVHMKRALRIEGNRPHLHYNLGQLYYQAGLSDLAFLHWREGLRLVPIDDPLQKARLLRQLAATHLTNSRVSAKLACSYARDCSSLESRQRYRNDCLGLVQKYCR